MPISRGTFTAGTVMMFVQTAAPTGWTKSVAHNDKALRVVSGAASSGGTNSFSAVMAQTTDGAVTLSAAQSGTAAHGHGEKTNTAPASGGTAATGYLSQYEYTGSGPQMNSATNTTNNVMIAAATATAAASSHAHSLTMAMQYVDCIIATKN